jgi:hypothetical protein
VVMNIDNVNKPQQAAPVTQPTATKR